MTKNREEALALLNEWVLSESLKKHMFAVETVMRAYAKKFGEDEDLWGICGLLHDFDYEKHPSEQEHPFIGTKILKEQGYPQEMVDAILGHALYSGVARESNMAKVLFAVDELTGFVVACAWIRPDKIQGLTPQSVNKKLKIKTFAEKVSREDIALGVAELGVDKDEHIAFVIKALQDNAENLGLNP
jgi:putative nucleotidyltransferase with HDIG domain